MIKRLRELLLGLECESVRGPLDPLVHRIISDSRQARPGDLFVAIRGSKHDGHEHVLEALRRGAVAVVCERISSHRSLNVTYITVKDSRKALADLACAFYDHPTRRLFTVGVTGTKGKSSVAHLSAAVLGLEQTELISTITNALQRGTEQTTPEAPEIQRIAWEAVQVEKTHFVLEVSAHALSQERVRGVDFNAAIFTNLSHDHLDYYGRTEDYLQAKLRLFTQLPPTGTAIVNLDDPISHRVIAATRARVWTYGLMRAADIWADELELGPDGSQALVHTPQGTFPLRLHFPGSFYIQNALAAVGVGLLRELPLSLIRDRLEAVRHLEGRLERFVTPEGVTIVIDFAHSPDSLAKAIRTLRPFYSQMITVFGCGGDSDRRKRPMMGTISGCLSDYTIITSDNPKSEDPEMIIHEIEEGLRALGVPYEAIVDRGRAIRRALELARPGDCVLIAGKGHERTQIFKDYQVPFNDKAYLKELGVIAPEAPCGVD